MVNFRMLAVTAILMHAFGVGAEVIPQAEIYLNASASLDDSGIRANADENSGGMRLSLDSSKSEDVKASARISVDSVDALTLDRAYVKARFPWLIPDSSLRMTVGKAPLAWGKGFVFNAGDPIFGSMPTFTGLSDGEYRTATDWMAVAYIPLAQFSFAELVYLPPMQKKGMLEGTISNRAGGRLFVTPDFQLLQSIEGGYLFEQTKAEKKHTGYVALDGSLYFDYYGAVSVSTDIINGSESEEENDNDKRITAYQISFGLFRAFRFIPGLPFSIRAEGLLFPEDNKQIWYPAIQSSVTDSISISLQGLFATGENSKQTDVSAQGTTTAEANFQSGSGMAGITCAWKALKGFTLSLAAYKYFEKGEILKPGCTVSLGASCIF